MKQLIWTDKQGGEVSGVGLVSKGSIFNIDDKRAESFIKQGKAKLKTSTVKTSTTKSTN